MTALTTILRRLTLAAALVIPTTGPVFGQAMSEKFASHFTETIANGAFQRTGYNVIAAASHVTTSYSQGAGSVHLVADYTFTVARQRSVPVNESQRYTFIGVGIYDFDETGQVQQIYVSGSFTTVSGLASVRFAYSSTNHLDTRVLDETLDVTNTGPGVAHYAVSKHAVSAVSGNVEVYTVDAAVTVDGVVSTAHDTTAITDGGGDTSTVVTLSTSSDTLGRSTRVDASYALTIDSLHEASVVFTQFDITKQSGVYSLNPARPSTFTTSKIDNDTYGVNYSIRLQRPSPLRSIEVVVGGTCALTRPSGSSLLGDDEWSWKTFAKYTVTGAISCAGAGAVGGAISTDSAAPIGAGAGALLGGVSGAVGGALLYTSEQAWEWVFGDNSNLVPQVTGRMRCVASTYFEGHVDFVTVDYDAAGGASFSTN